MSSKGAQAMLLEAWQQETWQVARRFKDVLRTMEPGQRVTSDVARTWPNLLVLRSAGYIHTADTGTGFFRVLRAFEGHRVGDLMQFDDLDVACRMVRWQWVEHANVIPEKPLGEFQCKDCNQEFANIRGLNIHRARIHDVH